MSCDVGKATDGLENELWRRWSDGKIGEWAANLFVTSPTSHLILQPFRRFTYVTAHSPTLPLFHLRHSSFSNPSFASPTSQALHLRHLASCPCTVGKMWKGGSVKQAVRWTKRNLDRFFSGFLPFSSATTFIPIFLHTRLIPFHPFLWWCIRHEWPEFLLFTDLQQRGFIGSHSSTRLCVGHRYF